MYSVQSKLRTEYARVFFFFSSCISSIIYCKNRFARFSRLLIFLRSSCISPSNFTESMEITPYLIALNNENIKYLFVSQLHTHAVVHDGWLLCSDQNLTSNLKNHELDAHGTTSLSQPATLAIWGWKFIVRMWRNASSELCLFVWVNIFVCRYTSAKCNNVNIYYMLLCCNAVLYLLMGEHPYSLIRMICCMFTFLLNASLFCYFGFARAQKNPEAHIEHNWMSLYKYLSKRVLKSLCSFIWWPFHSFDQLSITMCWMNYSI